MRQRLAIFVTGRVQGVGFRPFVYGLANRLQLAGFVRNLPGGVQIEIEGEAEAIGAFRLRLSENVPPLARVDRIRCEPRPIDGAAKFHIEQSADLGAVSSTIEVAPDAATCADCLRELFDTADRRFRYPFLNCTHCGPRLTIVRGVPYDRLRTTMSRFPMCAQCQAEYDDPADRRFHAQPVACAACGPRLQLFDAQGAILPQTSDAALTAFAAALRAGQIGAMKGLGGYHLVCDARSETAVAELRRRKHREQKPLAVMVRDIAAAEELGEVSPMERGILASPAAPIVLLRRRVNANELPDAVAPANQSLGILLPYTPLHHLLMREPGIGPLVMTSGNRSDEPIAIREPDVFEQLRGIADLFLAHDRPIQIRCDDSVVRAIGTLPMPIRRSRGYSPQSVLLPLACRAPILAVGGQQKVTFALGRDRQAVISHHIGDLDHFEAFQAFERDVVQFEDLFQARPRCIAHDLHPDYASTRYAQARASREEIELIGVQHHHAHMASCMAEHGIRDRQVIGVTFDGTGFGLDGAIWGGEFLIGDYSTFRRAAHLRYLRLPGGEVAIRQPWRSALAHLRDAGASCGPFEARQDAHAMRTVSKMIERRLNAPLTSSAGRLFDAIASLIGLRDQVGYEGQAAVELEQCAAAASASRDGAIYPFELIEGETPPLTIDIRPMIRGIAAEVRRGIEPCVIARRFHSTLATIILAVCKMLRTSAQLNTVALSGGVFCNAMLLDETRSLLRDEGFDVLSHRQAPSNDGGLSLGQLAVAAAAFRPAGS